MPTALTRHVGLNAGTWVLETLVKHYFDHLFNKTSTAGTAAQTTPGARKTSAGHNANLRREEILYDEAFHIVKSFMEASTHHTVEELQRFSNAHTPSPPWIHVVRLLVPMSCCDEAARLLIKALGGEDVTRHVVGGTKWWQVRGLRGVDAQWIVAKKDYVKAKRQKKERERSMRERDEKRAQRREASQNEEDEFNMDEEPVYQPEMDEMRCILYFHGGGYYFGSVDQERYFMQRFARKIGGRLLAVNYRLAPQYPFPCAIQDALAAYLYLIRPPDGSLHSAVDPAHIVVGGDSAGGGLTLALLQVLRDAELPLPAGGVLISPWCDLTHSFPSIHLNTNTDIIPQYGLALHKPSPLWPPPPDEMATHVQERLRSHIKDLMKHYSRRHRSSSKSNRSERSIGSRFFSRRHSTGSQISLPPNPPSLQDLTLSRQTTDIRASAVSQSEEHVTLGQEASLPTAVDPGASQTISMELPDGERLEIHDQVQLYASNNLLVHPLVSPALSYLGGLPPLLVIASDAEVLRDEILYSAHKAAHPERYPVKPEARDLYPALKGIESRYGPTKVHLQVYDEAAHVLPVLFSFTTPAKFCFRAMASFSKYVTGSMVPSPILNPSKIVESPLPSPTSTKFPSIRRALSLGVPRRSSLLNRRNSESPKVNRKSVIVETPEEHSLSESTIINGNRADGGYFADPDGEQERASMSSEEGPNDVFTEDSPPLLNGARYAGETSVYSSSSTAASSSKGNSSTPFIDYMIRERISMHGEIRPLEPEDELDACNMPIESIGVVAELAMRRYLEGRSKWNTRFARTTKSVEKYRKRNLDIAKKESVRNVEQLQKYFFQNGDDHVPNNEGINVAGVEEGLSRSAASWAWAWAIDGDERPPASSIVSRRDTEEARRLSKIADLATGEEHQMSGNNLWSFLINTLTLDKGNQESEKGSSSPATSDAPPKKTGKIRRLMSLSVAGHPKHGSWES